MKGKISPRFWFYLTHSRMLAEWKLSNGGRGFDESLEQVINMHMGKCSKTAVILNENMALQLFTTLKNEKKPVFYGKDAIIDTFKGYTYKGYFPYHVLRRIRFSFHSGIIEWWTNYLKWFLVLKTQIGHASSHAKIDIESNGTHLIKTLITLVQAFMFCP